LRDINGCGSGVNTSVGGLTETGLLWANMGLKIASSFTRDKTPYHG
jgi:hypothetical protein